MRTQDRDTVDVFDTSVSGTRAELCLYALHQAPPADRYRPLHSFAR